MQPTLQTIRKELAEYYPPREIEGLIQWIFFFLFGWSLTDLVLRSEERLSTRNRHTIREVVRRLQEYEPVQYIFGQTSFEGIRLKVNPAVLIPRPETAELTNRIIRETSHPNGNILDIGTGSGCIALALKHSLPGATVSGCDYLEEIVALARENASLNHLEVSFWVADILRWEEYPDWQHPDIIVSNPPYITEEEKKSMKKNVLGYEPAAALFVPGEDPLLFYRTILLFARQWMNPGGELYFEINEQYGAEVQSLLRMMGFVEAGIENDLNGKPRMAKGLKPG